jgi:WD40 repeat protein
MQRARSVFIAGLTVLLVAQATRAQLEPVPDKELPLEPVRTFKALLGSVNWVAFSPDESVIALGCQNSDTVFLYDVETGKERARIKLASTPLDPFAFAFSADGKTLAWKEVGLRGGVMRVFDTSDGKLVRQFSLGQVAPTVHAYGAAFTADGKLFAVANALTKKGVDLWNVETGKPVRTFAQEDPNSCAFSPDGKVLATQDTYGQVRLWDVASGKKLHELDRPMKPRQLSIETVLAFSPDGKRLAAGGPFLDDHAILVWDVESRKKVQTLEVVEGKAAFPFSALVFTPHAKWVGVSTRGGFTNGITFWDVESGKKVGLLKPDGRVRGTGFVEKSVTFTRSGKYLTGSLAGDVVLYAPRKKTDEKELEFVVPANDKTVKPKD